MPKIKINDKEIDFQNGMTVLQACELAGAEIPRFCYHEKLSIAGNCRMCLVEMEKSPKPIASCAMPATEGMVIKTNTDLVEKARKGVMEFLLANHPLDCPVCDQGGECDLQDQSMYYGIDKSRFVENKRAVEDKYLGPLIKTQMTRCIHCTRCVRFATEVAGVTELGAIGRGENMQITTYLEKSMESELSANVIDLCPVGALTSKPYAFEARPWELKKTESIDIMDAVGSNVRIDTYGWEVKRTLPRINEEINEEWLSDKSRFACDGLLKQRLEVPYKKENNKFIKISWDEAIDIISKKISSVAPNQIGGLVGDLVNMENIYNFKKFLESLGTKNYDFREKNIYIDPSNQQNYIFNSTIKGIEESDLILLIGTNPRHEATMVNARIRKAVINNNTPVFAIGDPGDLTYDYKLLGKDTDTLKKVFDGTSVLSKILEKKQKPIFIVGESFLEINNAKELFNNIKYYLKQNNFFKENWNPFNILIQNASTVGALDLGFYSLDESNNFIFFDQLKEKKINLLFLLGYDNHNFQKQSEFIIYIGSHGDKGAEIADIILPNPAYTEENGLFTNLEGRVQEARKASYPIGEAKHTSEIFNLILEKQNKSKNNFQLKEIREIIFKSVNNFQGLEVLPKANIINENISKKMNITNEKITIKDLDYYFSNAIARASKTMSDCRNIRTKKEIKDVVNQ